ncbi:hypothetical protein AMTR_s00028p00132180 [Amborella trichopoda]|uniref:Uncharacterized protein n=1 Tax=Amborella trichopoda TaxID=13333 RepID=W1PSA5_AMBTC|nr:hypothetical protein AMTR_s00028p00132180 [Amborella trichopoda]
MGGKKKTKEWELQSTGKGARWTGGQRTQESEREQELRTTMRELQGEKAVDERELVGGRWSWKKEDAAAEERRDWLLVREGGGR